MEHAPPGYRPSELLPGARGMVCFGLPVPRGVYGTTRHQVETVWRSQSLYYRRLDTISLRLAQLLEEQGARTLPAFGCCPMAVNKKGSIAGYLNMIRIGALTGLGAIGRNALLVHSRYGSHLMLGGVVTTAELPAVRAGDTGVHGCPEGCRICIDACPARAITNKGRIHVMRCLSYTARTPFVSRLRFGVLTKLNPEAAARLMNRRAFDEHSVHICSRCVEQCPLGDWVA